MQPKLYLMRVKDTEPYASFDLPGTQVLDIAYRGSSLYVVGGSFVSVVNGDKLETVLKNGEVQTVAYDYSASGDLVVAYSSYSNATQNTVPCRAPSRICLPPAVGWPCFLPIKSKFISCQTAVSYIRRIVRTQSGPSP